MQKQANKLESDSNARYRVAAVVYAVAILRAFSRERFRRSADELAREIGLSQALTRRTLNTLCRWGLMRRLDDGKAYELGLRWLQLADRRRHQFDIREAALPIMRHMRDVVNETVILSVRAGNKRINIDYMESTKTIRRITQAGLEAPLHVGAAGRALMSHFNKNELRDYAAAATELVGKTGAPPPIEDLEREVRKIRQLGYGIATSEITRETAAAAAPVLDYTGSVVAALTISCPKDRFVGELKEACIAQVMQGARELSKILGHHRGDEP